MTVAFERVIKCVIVFNSQATMYVIIIKWPLVILNLIIDYEQLENKALNFQFNS